MLCRWICMVPFLTDYVIVGEQIYYSVMYGWFIYINRHVLIYSYQINLLWNSGIDFGCCITITNTNRTRDVMFFTWFCHRCYLVLWGHLSKQPFHFLLVFLRYCCCLHTKRFVDYQHRYASRVTKELFLAASGFAFRRCLRNVGTTACKFYTRIYLLITHCIFTPLYFHGIVVVVLTLNRIITICINNTTFTLSSSLSHFLTM